MNFWTSYSDPHFEEKMKWNRKRKWRSQYVECSSAGKKKKREIDNKTRPIEWLNPLTKEICTTEYTEKEGNQRTLSGDNLFNANANVCFWTWKAGRARKNKGRNGFPKAICLERDRLTDWLTDWEVGINGEMRRLLRRPLPITLLQPPKCERGREAAAVIMILPWKNDELNRGGMGLLTKWICLVGNVEVIVLSDMSIRDKKLSQSLS